MAHPADYSEYTVVLKSRSGARMRLGYDIDITDFPDGLGNHVQMKISTRWENLGLDCPVPRELWMAVRSNARNMDTAVRSATNAASAIAMIISFCVNAAVEPPALHLAFNSATGLTRREFMEVFLPDESGLPRIGRWIDTDNFFAFGQAAFASPEAPRLFRALAQYQAALRYWNTGSRVLVLAHLYIACEVLTKAVQRVERTRLGITEIEHARLLGVDVTQKNWKMMAGFFARREYIFEGDKEIYKLAREASDDFEHGKADLGGVREVAETVTRELFDLVRSAILLVAPTLKQGICDAIMSKGPIDVSPLYKQITGYIVSEAPSDPLNLGPPSELFPLLRWSSRIKACRLEDDKLVFDPEETFTVQFAPGLKFERRDYAIYGGLNPSPEGSTISRPSGWAHEAFATRQSASGTLDAQVVKRDLLATVMPLVDAAAASGAGIGQTIPQMLAFHLFSQGVAYFEGAQKLIANYQPVEALPLLRGLVTIAARFEQIAEPQGEGLGLVIRLALGSTGEHPEKPGDAHTEGAGPDFLQAAVNAGLVVPDTVRPVETSAIWRSLTAEMQMAQLSIDSSYGMAGLHVRPVDKTGTIGFQTQLSPGPFTDLIASACVIAQLQLLKHAAPILSWSIDTQMIDEILVEANQLNEQAARIDPHLTSSADSS